jgi:hypothetical protein
MPAQAQIANGSFESGNYTGWTLFQGANSVLPQLGTWGIATNGQTIDSMEATFDFLDSIYVVQTSPGLPITYASTEGDHVAYLLTNGPQVHFMYQTVTFPSDAATLSWDMMYTNHNVTSPAFSSGQQIRITVRNPWTGGLIAVLYATTEGLSPLSVSMSSFTADVTAFAGTTVMLAAEVYAVSSAMDVAFDDFSVESKVPASVPVPAPVPVALEATCVSDTSVLWPPNHQMRQVMVMVTTTAPAPESGDPMPILVMGSSNEPDNASGGGDGNTTGDVAGDDGYTALVDLTGLFTWDASMGSEGAWVAMIDLCAERAAGGTDRTYAIEVMDPAGGSEPLANVQIAVPHSKRR